MTDSVKIPVIDRSGRLPEYATPGAAGMDVRAMLDSPVTIHPGGRALIPTGLRVELPAGYEMQLRPRSGLALRSGITLLNSPGTIDSVAHGDRIAQMVVARYATVEWIPAETLSDTDRGNGGFGHTGKN